jgi:hypothetical protein
MTDNTDKEQLDDLPDPQPENSSDETIPIKEAEPISSDQETENMEVHHHGHVHEKKKWKEYVFQFFMLFLAVFCGFLAEYQLEQTIERHREKDYIKSMIEDLRIDTIKLRSTIHSSERQIRGLDSLTSMIFNPTYSDSSIRKMYYLNRRYSTFLLVANFTKRTINQLKNAGGMRLIRNSIVSDSIVNYDEYAIKAEAQISNYAVYFQVPALQLSYSIFNGKYYIGVTRNTSSSILKDSTRMTLLTTDPIALNRFANQTLTGSDVLRSYIQQLKDQKNRCIQLITLMKKEYHLDNE